MSSTLCIDAMRDPMTNVIGFLGGRPPASNSNTGPTNGNGKMAVAMTMGDYKAARGTCKFLYDCLEHAWFLEVPLVGVHACFANHQGRSAAGGFVPRVFPWRSQLPRGPNPNSESWSLRTAMQLTEEWKMCGSLVEDVWICSQHHFTQSRLASSSSSISDGRQPANAMRSDAVRKERKEAAAKEKAKVMAAISQKSAGGAFTPGATSLSHLTLIFGGRSRDDLAETRSECFDSLTRFYPNFKRLRVSDLDWVVSPRSSGDTNTPAVGLLFDNITHFALESMPRLTEIPNQRFYRNEKLQHVRITNLPLLKTIGHGVLSHCTALVEMELNDVPSLETIGDGFLQASGRVSKFQMLRAPALLDVGPRFLNSCSQLTNLRFPHLSKWTNVEQDWMAGAGCVEVTIAHLPYLARLPMNTLKGCPNLQRVSFINLFRLGEILDGVLEECPQLEEVRFSGLCGIGYVSPDILGNSALRSSSSSPSSQFGATECVWDLEVLFDVAGSTSDSDEDLEPSGEGKVVCSQLLISAVRSVVNVINRKKAQRLKGVASNVLLPVAKEPAKVVPLAPPPVGKAPPPKRMAPPPPLAKK